jgi:GDP-D-mannose dehydratase
LLEASPVGETVNVCSGKTASLREVLAMMTGIAGYEIEVRVNPAFVRANEVKSLCGNAGKLGSLVGEGRKIPLEETLRWMYGDA